MNTDHKEIASAEESLLIIQNMINATKKDVQDNANHFLFWGYAVLVCCLIQYVLVFMNVEYNSIVWFSMPILGIGSFVFNMKNKKKDKVKTYTKSFLGYLWTAFGFSLIFFAFLSAQLKLNGLMFPITCMILYGLGLFVSGGALKFKPMVWGGVFCWVCSVVGCFIVDYNIILVLAASVFGGYIIPGHLLNARNERA